MCRLYPVASSIYQRSLQFNKSYFLEITDKEAEVILWGRIHAIILQSAWLLGRTANQNLAPTVTFTTIQDKKDIPSCHSSSDSPDNSEEQILPAHTEVIIYLLEITRYFQPFSHQMGKSDFSLSFVQLGRAQLCPAEQGLIFKIQKFKLFTALHNTSCNSKI